MPFACASKRHLLHSQEKAQNACFIQDFLSKELFATYEELGIVWYEGGAHGFKPDATVVIMYH